MCYPKPGPRCAGHLRAQIRRLEKRQAVARDAFMSGTSTDKDAQIARDLEQAHEEYAQTPAARRELIDRIETMPAGPEKTAAVDALEAATNSYRNKVNDYKATKAGLKAPTIVGELEPHELAHLGIFTATLEDGRVVAHNVNGPNIVCPVCQADRTKQKNCSECAGRGMVANVPYCPRPWDVITEGLHLGGHDNQPGGGDARVTDQFDVVVSLYEREGFGPNDGVPHHTHEMIDGELDPVDYPHLHRLADVVVEALQQDQKVLVRCQAGMNRSALVAGLALLKRGWTTDQIVTTMREARSEYVLFNQHFVGYLRDQENELRGTRNRCPDCKGRRSFFGVNCETCGGDGFISLPSAS